MNEKVSIANMRFTALTSSFIAAFSLLVAATPMPGGNLITIEEFKDWLANTDSEVTFIGEPLGDLSDLSKRNALNTIVTFCSNRVDDVCGGPCTVFNGAATCVAAPDTNCLSATNNVGFCDRANCGGSCNQLSTCGTPLSNGFCFTPGTQSILVSTA